jgi:hypothetical protein
VVAVRGEDQHPAGGQRFPWSSTLRPSGSLAAGHEAWRRRGPGHGRWTRLLDIVGDVVSAVRGNSDVEVFSSWEKACRWAGWSRARRDPAWRSEDALEQEFLEILHAPSEAVGGR